MTDNINKPSHYQDANGLEDLKKAREKHGWVTVNGAGSVITNKE